MNIFQPPQIPKISQEEFDKIDHEEMKRNPAFQKYEKRATERRQWKAEEELKRKKAQRSDWLKSNAVGIITLIVAVVTLIVTVLK